MAKLTKVEIECAGAKADVPLSAVFVFFDSSEEEFISIQPCPVCHKDHSIYAREWHPVDRIG